MQWIAALPLLATGCVGVMALVNNATVAGNVLAVDCRATLAMTVCLLRSLVAGCVGNYGFFIKKRG